jgi:hypothetical protein
MNMLKIRNLWLVLAIVAMIVGSFMAGRAGAQQLLPTEHQASYSFPRSWGEFHGVAAAPSGRGLAYVFVASDGTMRVVYNNPGGPEQIEVISRR